MSDKVVKNGENQRLDGTGSKHLLIKIKEDYYVDPDDISGVGPYCNEDHGGVSFLMKSGKYFSVPGVSVGEAMKKLAE